MGVYLTPQWFVLLAGACRRCSCYLHSVRVLSSSSSRSLRTYLDFVKFEHTLFALPFAYGGMLLAERRWPGGDTFFWITLAMIGARTASMALNRVIDAELDRKNPRTATREIPRGVLAKRDGWLLAVIGFILFSLAGWALNALTFMLLPVAVFFLAFYPYTKRFTWLCHYWLGFTIGAAAAGGWIAVTGAFSPAAITLWLGVGLWIAGFDIVYAMMDYQVDVQQGLYSVPARFGVTQALDMSALTHLLAWGLLALTLPLTGAGWPYALGLLAIAGILGLEHRLVRREGATSALRSFNANLYISSIMLLAIVVDIALV